MTKIVKKGDKMLFFYLFLFACSVFIFFTHFLRNLQLLVLNLILETSHSSAGTSATLEPVCPVGSKMKDILFIGKCSEKGPLKFWRKRGARRRHSGGGVSQNL